MMRGPRSSSVFGNLKKVFCLVILSFLLIPSFLWQSGHARGQCYLFVGNSADLDRNTVYQQIEALVVEYVSPLKEIPAAGISEKDRAVSCYYEAGLTMTGDTLTLSLNGFNAETEINGLARSSLSFPDNVRHALLRVLHRELPGSRKQKLCRGYGELLLEECPRNPRTIILYRTNPDRNFADASKQAQAFIREGLKSLIEEMETVEFAGMAGIIEGEANSGKMKTLLDKHRATAVILYSLEGGIQKSKSMMWHALADIIMTAEAYRLKGDRVVHTASLTTDPERIPVRKWGSDRAYREKHLGRAAKKLAKRWSEDDLLQFIETVR